MAPLVNLDALRRKANPSFVSTRRGPPKFGIDYLPPMTASLLNLAPVRGLSHTAQLLAKAGGVLPTSFDWTNALDVATKRMNGNAADAARVAAILQPLNQEGCGSCWAFATSSTLSDRYTLFQGLSTPLKLSPTYLLACNKGDNNGCEGGIPSVAGQFFESTGIPTWACQDYGWCPASGEVSNSDVPACTEISGNCYKDMGDGTVTDTTPIPKMYKAVQGSTQALPTPEAIKAEVFHNGPVTVTFTVYDDFVTRDNPDDMNKVGWLNTNNIYINLTDPMNPGKTQGLYGNHSPTSVLGNHAVVVVGWGLEPNPQGLSPSLTASLQQMFGGLFYWVVRNSWDVTWNGTGFFKIAMSVPELNINMTTYLDRSIIKNGYTQGGGTTFLPVVPESTPKVFTDGSSPGPPPMPSPPGPAPPPTPQPGPKPSPGPGKKNGGSSAGGSSANFWTQPGGIVTIVVICLAAIAIATTVIVLVKKKKRLGK